MSRFVSVAVAAALLGVPVSASAVLHTTSPGKNSVAVADDSAFLNMGGTITPLVGTITKAKPKRLLKVDAVIRAETGGVTMGTRLQPTVNGLPLTSPSLLQFHCPFPPSLTYCVGTGTFWLDIDAEGLAGQPLVIQLDGGRTDGNVGEYSASFTAEMIKK